MGVTRFVLGRLVGMVVVLLVVALVSFVVFYLLPSDPARMSCGRPCSPESLATAKKFMQLDQPWYQQFASFLGGIVAGRTFGTGVTAIHCPAPCFGYSFQQNEETFHLILSRLPVTASIAVGAAVLWLLAGIGVGVVSALRPGRPVDRIAMVGAVAGVSTPVFLTGLLGILVFGFTLDMVPTHGFVRFWDSPVDWAWHLVLPWLVLAFLHGALYARLTRGQMLEALGEDYIRTARAKGLTEARVVGRHALRNVLLPVVTVFGIDLGGLLGGAVITERVFGMPGVGSLMIDAVHAVDLPLLLGCTLFGAALIVVANFVVDVLYGVLDPRVRLN
ncbi:ABC transporter permease [Actinophytocola oryzae]|uniref:Peptide/nickel transport system permease protein n=1 Tax=Actinophytocola oryzae TaxID=502181 RepID=A0A4R7W0Z3_9PSEU|nr:ABC transporter permease [Actinophytocola oryzae]TDV56072.1 peptide/nickel transport system permease protein [Actinophytocola oryzae]